MSAKTARMARERAAAARVARERAAAKRRRLLLGGWAVGGVLLVVAVMVIVRVTSNSSDPEATDDATTSEQIAAAISGVTPTALDTVGQGAVGGLPTPLTGYDPLVAADGKPEVLYVGAEYCPYCAAQRWGLTIALERFGDFTGLQKSWSAADDAYPNTPTVSFHGATYTSDYVAFTGLEIAGRERVNGSYAPLDQLTPEQQVIVSALSGGSVPFTDFGNRWTQTGAAISPELFEGLTHAQVLAAIQDPGSDLGQAILGSANLFTTAICQLTDNQPAEVCTTAAATAYQGTF